MNQEIKDQWVNALTNGEYHQGTGELKTLKDEFCCLGVLCDLAVKAGVAKWLYQPSTGWLLIPANVTMEEAKDVGAVGSATLPRFVTEWAGMTKHEHNPTVVRDGDHIALTQANDSLELPFTTIAELIHETL